MRGRLRQREPQARDAAAGLMGARRVRVVDGSMVSEPGPTGSQWRLHYALGPPGLECQEVPLRPRDDGQTLKRVSVDAGDGFIADRGHANPGGISPVAKPEAAV